MAGQVITVAPATTGKPDMAVAMLAERTNACIYTGDSAALAPTAARANKVLSDDPGPRTVFLVHIVSGMAPPVDGTGGEGMALIRQPQDYRVPPRPIYRKLGIHSRAELAAAVAPQD